MTEYISVKITSGNQTNKEFLLCDNCKLSGDCDRITYCQPVVDIVKSISQDNAIIEPGDITIETDNINAASNRLFLILKSYER